MENMSQQMSKTETYLLRYFRTGFYGKRVSRIFEIPSISSKKPSISIGNPNISNQKFEIIGFLRIEFEILAISCEIRSNSKKM